MLEAVEEILEFTSGLSATSFAVDSKTQKAVMADLAIIGEAAAHVPDDVVLAHPELPWRSMRDMRNVVIHAYFQVDAAIVWQTIQGDLPDLALRLRHILEPDAGA